MNQPKFIQYWTQKINETLTQIPSTEHEDTVLVVSAHSLPKGLIERNNDPYPQELHHTAELLHNIQILYMLLKVGNLKVILEHLG
ncbi:ferrochelatase [Staphylococcus gallinarum]|uniref:Ferrochelatase n=1 Tax=Staphylococcus gallinarum TaxID=1293 RepID=A0A380FKH4_STAGA|nr:ferrochelatase [Staphylococcus gallinarum]